jgi:hypothetical protein
MWRHPLDQPQVGNLCLAFPKRLGIPMTANKQTYTFNLTLVCSNSEDLDKTRSLNEVVLRYHHELLHIGHSEFRVTNILHQFVAHQQQSHRHRNAITGRKQEVRNPS